MTRRRSPLFWLVAVAFAASLGWWFVTIPQYRRDLFSCVPAQAGVLLRVNDAAGRWPVWAANPAISGLLAALGAGSNVAARAGADDSLTEWLEAVAPGESAVAYLPSMGPAREPAWIMVSWIGGRSQRLRWMLKTGRIRGAKRLFSRNGHVAWQLPAPGLAPGMYLTVGAPEGHVVTCLSRDLGALLDVFDTYDGLAPSATTLEREPPELGGVELRGEYQHFGSWSLPPQRWSFAVTRADATSFAARVRGPWPHAWPETPGETNAVPLWNPAARHAVLQIRADRELAIGTLRGLLGDPQVLFDELIRRDASGALDLQLVDGPYAGRARGLRLPTAVAALPVMDEAATAARIRVILDQANRIYRWGLVPHDIQAGPFHGMAIESTADTPYARFDLHERAACLVTNGVFVFGSNTEGLTNLLLAVAAAPEPPESRIALDATAAADLWVDLRGGAKPLRVLLTAWSLMLDDRRAETEERSRQLNEAKDWVDSLAPLGQLRCTLRREGAFAAVEIQTGEKL